MVTIRTTMSASDILPTTHDQPEDSGWWDGISVNSHSHVSRALLALGLHPMALLTGDVSHVPRSLIGPLAALRDGGANAVNLHPSWSREYKAVIEIEGEQLAVNSHDHRGWLPADDLAQRLLGIAAEVSRVPVLERAKWALNWSQQEARRHLEQRVAEAGVTLLSPASAVLRDDAPAHWRELLNTLASQALDAGECGGYVVAICQSDFPTAPSFIFKQPANENWRVDLDIDEVHDVELNPHSSDWQELERRLFSAAETDEVLLHYMSLAESLDCDVRDGFLEDVQFVLVPVSRESFQRTFDCLPSMIRLLPPKGRHGQAVEETYLQLGWLSGRSDAMRSPGDGIFYRRTNFAASTECWRIDANFRELGHFQSTLLRFGASGLSWPVGHTGRQQGERFPFYDPGLRNVSHQFHLSSEAAQRTLSAEQADAILAALRVSGSAPGGEDFESLKAVKTTCLSESHMTDIARYIGASDISNRDLDEASVGRIGFPAYMVYGAEVNLCPFE